MIVNESIESLKRDKIVSFLIIFQLAISITLMFVTNTMINDLDNKKFKFNNTYKNINYYYLSDNYFNEDWEDISRQDDNLYRLKKLYNSFLNNNDFNYIVSTDQPIYIKNFKGENIFLDGYEIGFEHNAQYFMESDGTKKIYKSVKTLQVNNNFFETYNIELDEGNFFIENDYYFEKNNIHPIILGYEYKNIYKLGDIIECDYLEKRYKFEVSAFLKKDTSFYKRYNLTYLDRYMIIPSPEFEKMPIEINDKLFQFRLYFQKINGTICTKLDEGYILNLVNNLAMKCNLKEFNILRAIPYNINILSTQSDNLTKVLFITSIILNMIIVVTSTLILLNKIENNIHIYAIHLTCGATLGNIKKYITTEIILLVIISNLFALLFSYLLLGNKLFFNISNFFIPLFSTIIMIIPLFLTFYFLDKNNVNFFMRRE